MSRERKHSYATQAVLYRYSKFLPPHWRGEFQLFTLLFSVFYRCLFEFIQKTFILAQPLLSLRAPAIFKTDLFISTNFTCKIIVLFGNLYLSEIVITKSSVTWVDDHPKTLNHSGNHSGVTQGSHKTSW